MSKTGTVYLVGAGPGGFEAARVDGSSRRQTFVSIVLPLLLPYMTVAFVLRFIDSFKVFDIIYILTRGGPGTSTETIAVYVYRVAFQYFKTSQSAALGYILLFAVIVLTNLYLFFVRQRAVED